MLENQLLVKVTGKNSNRWEVDLSRIISPPASDEDEKLRNNLFAGVRGLSSLTSVLITSRDNHTVKITPQDFTKLDGKWIVQLDQNDPETRERAKDYKYSQTDDPENPGKKISDHANPLEIDLRQDFYAIARYSAGLLNPAYKPSTSGGGKVSDDTITAISECYKAGMKPETIAIVTGKTLVTVNKVIASLPKESS